MYYQQLHPDPILAEFIHSYWIVSTDSRCLPAPEHGVIPGGFVDLIFNLGERVYWSDSDNVFFNQARSFIVGPVDHFQRFRTEQHFELLGVRFHPGRFPLCNNLSLGKIRNQALPFDILCGDKNLALEIHTLEVCLAQMLTISERIACVEQFFKKTFSDWQEPDVLVSQGLNLIRETHGQISVQSLASILHTSERQLERKFAQHIGLSPKAFCRITRFRQVKSLLESLPVPGAGDLAYPCGYFDQTHLIQEFRFFTGQTPARYKHIQPVGFFLYDH